MINDMLKKTGEQLHKDLYIISFCEHIPPNSPPIQLQAKVKCYYLSFKINTNGLVTWKEDIYLSVKYFFRTSVCTMYITSSWEGCRLKIIPII